MKSAAGKNRGYYGLETSQERQGGLAHHNQQQRDDGGTNRRSLGNERQGELAHHHEQRDGGRTRRSLENEEARGEGESVGLGPFRMPSAVASGVGGTWDRGPFGPAPECPSSRKVFQIGVAMDTGFFKVSFADQCYYIFLDVKSNPTDF